MLLTQIFKCRKMESCGGFFVSAEGIPCHMACPGRFSLLCVGLAVSAYGKGGSQLSAGWGGAGQAQLSRAGCWSHTKPAAGLALLPEHPHTPMIWTEQQHKGRTEDRALYSAWKHTFHSANKLLLKSHLTGSGVIAVGAVPEFRRQEWLCVHLTIRGLVPPTQVSHHCMVLDT